MSSCPKCGYGFVNESLEPQRRIYNSCPRCGQVLSPPVVTGRPNETQEPEKPPYRPIIECNNRKE